MWERKAYYTEKEGYSATQGKWIKLNSEFFKKKELEENSIFSCWSRINISSDEAFWVPYPLSCTARRTEKFHLIFLSPLKTLVHHS